LPLEKSDGRIVEMVFKEKLFLAGLELSWRGKASKGDKVLW